MNLKPFVGKDVILQFKPGCAWIACQDDGHGNISPMMQNEGAVAVPFVQGKLLERDGAYVVKYKANKANLETTVVTEAIFAVTCLSEDRILAP